MSKCWMFTPLAQNGRGCLTSNFSMIGMFAGKRQFQTSWKRTTSWCHSLHSFWGIALLLKSKRQWVRMGHLVINWVCKMRLDLFSLILLGPFLYLFFGEAQLKQFHQFNQWCLPSSGWQLWFWMLRFGQTESCPKHYSFCFPPQNKYYINMEGSTQKHIGFFCWKFPTYVKDRWVLTKASNCAKQSVLETNAQLLSFYSHNCTAVRRKTPWQPTNGCSRTRLTSDLDVHLFQNYFSFVLSLDRFLMFMGVWWFLVFPSCRISSFPSCLISRDTG